MRMSRTGIAPLLCLALLPLTASLTAQTVTGLVLVNADTNNDIGPLNDGASIDLSALQTSNLNVRATTAGNVGSVRFALDGNPNHQTENVAPYTLAGDSNGNYNAWVPAQGPHTLTATPFSGSGASGTQGTALSVNFEVVNGTPGAGNHPPTASAGPDRFVVQPASSIQLLGSGSDADGPIQSYQWSQIAGPTVSIQGANSATPTITGLGTGAVAIFELTVTDSDGNTARDQVLVASIPGNTAAGTVSGELRQWHRVTVDFQGPTASETAQPNPFLEYRLEVSFTHSNRSFLVPGFYAADGNAAESSATGGSTWRVHFTPDATGTWTYTALFRSGTHVAVADDGTAGSAQNSIHGARGSFTVLASNKTSPDFRAEGLLRYVGQHHLRFAGSGRYFLKGGADSPENFLAYVDFDGTYDSGGSFLHAYAAHAGDWQAGDPDWDGNRGREIIGALNYLSTKGMNSVYFLTMNVNGDGKDVWPWTGHTERNRFDVSKLAQWEIVFQHMDAVGLQLHVVTQETENDQLLDGGALGDLRKLYYRELVARFSHHLAVTWNLGEENTNTDAQRQQFASWIRALDPYDHPIVIHTFPGSQTSVYTPLLGFPHLEGPSLQQGLGSVHSNTLQWIQASAAAGRPWVACNDENGPANDGVVPDASDFWHDAVRKQALWGNLMAGGGGSEWYFGYSFAHDDLDCEDWRSRDHMWTLTRYALDFFATYLPFWDMQSADSLTSNSSAHCLALAGSVYAVYLPTGGTTSLQLDQGSYEVLWFDPRGGGPLQIGSVAGVSGPGSVALGTAPSQPGQDWAILVRRQQVSFLRGDCNSDVTLNISDPIRALDLLFVMGTPASCLDACDANDDGAFDLADAIQLLNVLFQTAQLPPPIGGCGLDPTTDALGCANGGPCP